LNIENQKQPRDLGDDIEQFSSRLSRAEQETLAHRTDSPEATAPASNHVEQLKRLEKLGTNRNSTRTMQRL